MIVLALCLFGEIAFPQQPDIRLECFSAPRNDGDLCFFAPHENEHVVNAYLAEKVQATRGRFVVLRQSGERHVVLEVQGQRFEVDPNRIFTRAGAGSSLLKLNPHLKKDSAVFPMALERTVALGRFVLEQMGAFKNKNLIMIAVHNNTEGFDNDGRGGEGTISIRRYAMKLEAGAKYIKSIHIGDGDEDDLFFINRQSDFETLKKLGWNIVLQHPQVATLPDEDDGSLSVYAEMEGHRYMNIEAQRKEGDDHLEVQKKMVDVVFQITE